jgi:hypothetical protein
MSAGLIRCDVSGNPCDFGKVGRARVPVWVVPTILPSERNGVMNEQANHALLQRALCAFNACFVDPRGTVERECRVSAGSPAIGNSFGKRQVSAVTQE